MKKLVFLYNYFIYRLRAINEHGVHSPFVFDLLTNVIYNNNDYYCFKKIENVSEQLLRSKKTTRVIPSIYSQLLFRLVNHFQPSHIVTIGTSMGISTAYMAAASSKIDLLIIEENREIAEMASQNFKLLKLKNIEQKIGRIETVLAEVLTGCPTLNFVLFNGNHCKQDTLNYFRLCLEKTNDASIFVFEGMNTSSEMKEVWNEIKNNKRVTVTLDLFHLGIVFFRKEQVKQHFLIKF